MGTRSQRSHASSWSSKCGLRWSPLTPWGHDPSTGVPVAQIEDISSDRRGQRSAAGANGYRRCSDRVVIALEHGCRNGKRCGESRIVYRERVMK